ncbi:pyridoxal-phosphate dependent enzyme [Streptomyces avicenniae]|uniref:pyridoxal-phosphate dependent enzyme n=1 Tax=Streptomyces avicenniae TaxID=500153 RepID=UPI000ABFBDF2|nr:pyridoxal-phosphate dependent enzyme [Streptomyces avicenniae]
MRANGAGGWAAEAILRLMADAGPATPTPLRRVPLPALPDVDLYLKDESALPTGSLKYRLAQAMLCQAIGTGALARGMTVVMGTGGAVAVATARLATLAGLPFVAVVPAKTPRAVRAGIERQGGACRDAEGPPAGLHEEARAFAARVGAHFLDHYTDAAPALAAWPGPTAADEIFAALRTHRHPVPAWLVAGAGTGATSAALGRHIRGGGHPTRLAVADPENSAYFPAWASGCRDYATGMPSRVPGIGRPRVEPGFAPELIDLVIPVPDAAGAAALRWLHGTAGVPAGPATGTVLWAACHLAARLREAGTGGSVVAVMGDGAEPYRATHLDPAWADAHGLAPGRYAADLERFAATGAWRFGSGARRASA